MTGAPVPRGADRVVIVEDCEVRGASVTVSGVPDAGANICLRGEDIRAGQVVLEAGTRLAPQHLGIAAMAGREVVAVFGRPVVTVLTTGTEVVPATWALTPGMVRDANLPLICAQLETAGFPPAAWIHSNDDPASLRETAAQLLSASDVLVAAGGVSMGTRDFVPSILEALGMDIRVRGVAQKPGKPLLFAVDPAGRSAFGLPGNPVSVMVSLEEYVLPHLRRMSGLAGCRKRVFEGVLTDAYGKEPGRLHFLRVEARREGAEWMLRLPESSGSGDLMSTSAANGLALVGEGETRLLPGDGVPFHFLYSHAGELSFE